MIFAAPCSDPMPDVWLHPDHATAVRADFSQNFTDMTYLIRRSVIGARVPAS